MTASKLTIELSQHISDILSKETEYDELDILCTGAPIFLLFQCVLLYCFVRYCDFFRIVLLLFWLLHQRRDCF